MAGADPATVSQAERVAQGLLVAGGIDGWAWHSGPERFQPDRRRQNLLVAAGWTVLRFTWADLVERPDQVVATVVRTLARLSPLGERRDSG